MGFVYSVKRKFIEVVFTASLFFAWRFKNASKRDECFID